MYDLLMQDNFLKKCYCTTKSQDIYNKLKNYLELKNISMKNITSCAAYGAPKMMDKKNGCLKLIKDINPEMVIVHCVIHKDT